MATAPQAFRRFPAAVSSFKGRLHLLSRAQTFDDQMSKQWNTYDFQRFLYDSIRMVIMMWFNQQIWWLNRPAWNWNMEGGDKHGQQWSKKRGDPPKWVKIGISHSEKFGTGKGEEWHLLRCQLAQLWHALPALPIILLATVPLPSPIYLFIYWLYTDLWIYSMQYAFIMFISRICLLNLRWCHHLISCNLG